MRKQISMVITKEQEIFTKNGLQARSQYSCSDIQTVHPTLLIYLQ
jgi:hypothetical protein